LEEACGSDNKHKANELKARITATSISVNPKGIGAYNVPNYARYMMTTNDTDPVLVENGDRRFVMIACGTYHLNDHAWWQPIRDILLTPRGGAVIGQWLMEHDISTWNPRSIPDTEFKRLAAEECRPVEHLYVQDVWDGEEIRSVELHSKYILYCQENNLHYIKSAKTFGAKIAPLVRDHIVIKRRDMQGVLYSRPLAVNQIVTPSGGE
jgi:hypothetical protein